MNRNAYNSNSQGGKHEEGNKEGSEDYQNAQEQSTSALTRTACFPDGYARVVARYAPDGR